jgi:phospholipid/cholesterol/gamma-HCH transport system substrate-binding protein
MTLIKEKDQRFVNIEKKIGLFIMAAVAGILLLVFSLVAKSEIFTPKTKIYITADSGEGINEGMAVKLKGFKIGAVKRLDLDDAARVKVTLSIYSKYMVWIKADSTAKLLKEGLIGDGIIEISPGSATAGKIAENGTIPFERAKGLSAIAEELKEEIKPVLNDIKKILAYVNDPQGEIRQILVNIKTLSGDLSGTRQRVDTLLSDADKGVNTSVKKLEALLDSSRQPIGTLNELLRKVDKDVPRLLEGLNKSLENVQKTTEEIRKATEQTAPRLPGIMEKGADIADGTKDVVNSVKKVWPIRTFIRNPEGKVLEVDSYE